MAFQCPYMTDLDRVWIAGSAFALGILSERSVISIVMKDMYMYDDDDARYRNDQSAY